MPISSFYAAYGDIGKPHRQRAGLHRDPSTTVSSSALVNAQTSGGASVEVGTKWELFDRRLLATAALFQTDVDNARTNASMPTQRERRLDRQPSTGEYRVRGIELGVAGNITRDWSVFGGLVLLDTEVLKSDDLNPQDIGRRLGQYSADAVLAAVALPVDRRNWLWVERRRTAARFTLATWPPTLRNNHTVRLVAVRCICRVRDLEELGDRGTGLNLTDELYYDAIYQSAGITGENGTFAFVAPGRAGYLTVKWKYD